MHFQSILKKLTVIVGIGMLAAILQAQIAPVLNLTSPEDIGPSPQTSTGMGMSSTVFNGTIYVAFQGHNNNSLWIQTSTDGQHYTDPGSNYSTIVMSYAPSITTFNGKLYVAYTTLSGGINVISSSDGVNFSSPVAAYVPLGGTNPNVTSPPSLVAYDELYVFWESDYTNNGVDDNIIKEVGTADGISWSEYSGFGSYCEYTWNNGYGGAPSRPRTQAAVGAAVFNNYLFVATQLGDPNVDGSNELEVCSVRAAYYGQAGPFVHFYPGIYPGSGISATVLNGSLYLAFKYNHSNNMLELTGTDDGINFTTPVTSYGAIRIWGSNEIAPSVTTFNGQIYGYYTANNSSHNIYMVHSY